MTRNVATVNEITYTLTPGEVERAVKQFIQDHRAEGHAHLGVCRTDATVTMLPDGSAQCVNLYRQFVVVDCCPEPRPEPGEERP